LLVPWFLVELSAVGYQRQLPGARNQEPVTNSQMTSPPSPDPRPNPEPFPHPDPKPASPDETPVTIIELPPNQPSPGVPVDNPLPS